MTRPVLFDTWAWVEVLRGSEAGVRISGRYLDDPSQVVWTADISLVEMAASLHRDGVDAGRIRSSVEEVVARSDLVLRTEIRDAVAAPEARALLRVQRKDASLADGLIFAMARNRGALIVTCDHAFRGLPDAVCP